MCVVTPSFFSFIFSLLFFLFLFSYLFFFKQNTRLNLRFNHLLLFSCHDFYLLERAHMYCRTFQEGSMPILQRYKLVYIKVVHGEGQTLIVEESPIVRADREKKEKIKFNAMEKLRIAAGECCVSFLK